MVSKTESEFKMPTTYNVTVDNSLEGFDIKIVKSDSSKDADNVAISEALQNTMDNIIAADTRYSEALDSVNAASYPIADTLQLGNAMLYMSDAVCSAFGYENTPQNSSNINTAMKNLFPSFATLCKGANKDELRHRRSKAKMIASRIPDNFEVIKGVTFINWENLTGSSDISNLKPKQLADKIYSKESKDAKRKAKIEADAEPVTASFLIANFKEIANKEKISWTLILNELQSEFEAQATAEQLKAISDLKAAHAAELTAFEAANAKAIKERNKLVGKVKQQNTLDQNSKANAKIIASTNSEKARGFGRGINEMTTFRVG